MSEPVEISAAQFFDFIAAPQLAVVFVSVHSAHPVNRVLGQRLGEAQGNDVPYGAIGLLDLIVTASPALAFLRRGLASCGVSMPIDVLPGYYLFHRGRMLAWDAGLPSRNDAGPIARGSLLGMIAFAFNRDLAFLGTALRIAIDEATAVRLTAQFRRIADDDSVKARRSPRARPDDDLARAYRTLGVAPTATDR